MTKVRLNGRQVVMVGSSWARVSVKVAEKLAGGRKELRRMFEYAYCVYGQNRHAASEIHMLASGAKLAYRMTGSRVEWIVYGYAYMGNDVLQMLFPYMTKEQVEELKLPSWMLEELNKKHNPDQALVGTVSA